MAQQDNTPAAGSGNKITAAHVAQHLKAAPCSVGMVEALAGLNPQDAAERESLWGQYRHLFAAPHPAAMTAVMNHCKKLTAQRVNAGELTLWHWGMKGGAA